MIGCFFHAYKRGEKMQKTTNYGLLKPDPEDFYNIEDFNNNMDVIDEELKKAAQTGGGSSEELTEHLANTNNPHKVTASQVGLGNVPNVTTNNQTPTYAVPDTVQELASGEKLSVAMGKTAKAVKEFISTQQQVVDLEAENFTTYKSWESLGTTAATVTTLTGLIPWQSKLAVCVNATDRDALYANGIIPEQNMGALEVTNYGLRGFARFTADSGIVYTSTVANCNTNAFEWKVQVTDEDVQFKNVLAPEDEYSLKEYCAELINIFGSEHGHILVPINYFTDEDAFYAYFGDTRAGDIAEIYYWDSWRAEITIKCHTSTWREDHILSLTFAPNALSSMTDEQFYALFKVIPWHSNTITTADGKMGMNSNNEGGNFWWTAPDGRMWEIDTYANSFARLFRYNTDGTISSFEFHADNGTIVSNGRHFNTRAGEDFVADTAENWIAQVKEYCANNLPYGITSFFAGWSGKNYGIATFETLRVTSGEIDVAKLTVFNPSYAPQPVTFFYNSINGWTQCTPVFNLYGDVLEITTF